jgi:hypothetical protein
LRPEIDIANALEALQVTVIKYIWFCSCSNLNWVTRIELGTDVCVVEAFDVLMYAWLPRASPSRGVVTVYSLLDYDIEAGTLSGLLLERTIGEGEG